MGLAVSNIATLKTITIDAKRVRFVESEKALFWSDPAASDTADNVTIIAPNTGTGRWFKMYARETNPSGFTVTILTSAPSTTSTQHRGYYICNSSSNNVLTLELPASPNVGDTIRIRKIDATGWSRRVSINRNGNKINGVSSNYGLVNQNQYVELIYIDSTTGWHTEDIRNLTPESSVVSIPYTSDLGNDIIHYIGTLKNTVTYVNPANSSTSTTLPIDIYYLGGTSPSFYVQPTNRSTGDTSSNVSFTSAPHPWITIFLGKQYPIQVRLSRLSLYNVTSTSFNLITAFKLYGGLTRDMSFENSATYIERTYKFPNYDLIATVDAGLQTRPSWSHYTIDATKFYDTFIIAPYKYDIATGSYVYNVNNSNGYGFNEIQLWGDIIWP